MIDSCQGIEFHTSGYCEVWTRSGGIRATAWRQNYQCHRYLEARQTDFPALLNFEPVNGGKDQACRGLSLSDNSPSYFTVETASSIEDCATKCAQHGACQGIEYHPSGRCEIWTRSGGILATKPLDYYQCHRYLVPPGFHPVDGAENRACRGASVDDNLAEHYLVVQGIATAKECFAECTNNPTCKGIEFSPGRCEVWTRTAGIQQSAEHAGFQCYRYSEIPQGSVVDQAFEE